MAGELPARLTFLKRGSSLVCALGGAMTRRVGRARASSRSVFMWQWSSRDCVMSTASRGGSPATCRHRRKGGTGSAMPQGGPNGPIGPAAPSQIAVSQKQRPLKVSAGYRCSRSAHIGLGPRHLVKPFPASLAAGQTPMMVQAELKGRLHFHGPVTMKGLSRSPTPRCVSGQPSTRLLQAQPVNPQVGRRWALTVRSLVARFLAE